MSRLPFRCGAGQGGRRRSCRRRWPTCAPASCRTRSVPCAGSATAWTGGCPQRPGGWRDDRRAGADRGRRRPVRGRSVRQATHERRLGGRAAGSSTLLARSALVVQAVLDGVLTQQQATVLARLVGRIPTGALQDAPAVIAHDRGGTGPRDSSRRNVSHLLASRCEPASTPTGRPRRADGSCRPPARVTAACAAASGLPAPQAETV